MLRHVHRLVLAVLVSSTPALAQDRFMAPLPSDSEMAISRDVEFANAGGRSFKFDLYRPALAKEPNPVPVVIFFNGVGADRMRGHVQYTSWPRYVTTAGLAGVTMDSTEATAAEDFDRLVKHLEANAATLGIDPKRIVVWACSANVRRGLPMVQEPARTTVIGAVMYYGSSEVSAFRLDLPVLFVRAGTDNAGLNRGMGLTAAAALAANAPISLINHPAGRHGFDLRDDTDTTRDVMARTLAFMKESARRENIAARMRTLTSARAAAALFAQDWPAAAAAYATLAKENPQDPEPHQRLAEALMGQGEYQRAISAFQRSLELNTPNRGIVSFALVRAHVKLGDIDGAVAWLEKMKPFFRFFGQQLRTEAELAPLRADPRFEKIMSS
jgi:tetratricopeptide (TPR) repeat protein